MLDIKKGTNAAVMKDRNIRLILNMVHQNRCSRAEIAKKSGLTKATVTILTEELIREGLIKEAKDEEYSGVGRCPIKLSLCKNSVHVVGIAIWRNGYHIGLYNLAGVDPIIRSPEINMSADEYKYVKFRIKNTSRDGNMIMLFITKDDKTWNGEKTYAVNISTTDTEYKEYIVDLSTCSKWSGTITQLRLDPVNPAGTSAVDGEFYIDSIEFFKEKPQ